MNVTFNMLATPGMFAHPIYQRGYANALWQRQANAEPPQVVKRRGEDGVEKFFKGTSVKIARRRGADANGHALLRYALWKRQASAQRTYGAMMNSCRNAEQKLPASTCSSSSSATCNMTLPLES